MTTDRDLAAVQRASLELLATLGFRATDRTKMATAASELARNALVHAAAGVVIFEEVRESGRTGLRITVEDQGPGIADVEQAMADGYSTRGSLGLGLGGAKRLVHEFDIRSSPGQGTVVSITRWR